MYFCKCHLVVKENLLRGMDFLHKYFSCELISQRPHAKHLHTDTLNMLHISPILWHV